MVWTLIAALIGSLAGICVFVYYLRQGQFDHGEEVKYQVFWEEDKK